MLDRTSYDFWKAFGDGRFYTLTSLFEDERRDNAVFSDARTMRTTEALLLLVRLYRRLGASDNDQVSVGFRHGGLAGRELHVAGTRMMAHHPTATVDAIDTSLVTTVSGIETDITTLVRQVVDPRLALFDLFDVSPKILDSTTEGYVLGEVR